MSEIIGSLGNTTVIRRKKLLSGIDHFFDQRWSFSWFKWTYFMFSFVFVWDIYTFIFLSEYGHYLETCSIKDDREAKFVDKYMGCLQGVLVGDCLGAPFDSAFKDRHGLEDDPFDYDVTSFLINIRTNKVLPGPSAGRNHRAAKGEHIEFLNNN